MSQPQSTVLNGPSGELTMAFKDAEHPNLDMNKVTTPVADLIQSANNSSPRPQLQRIDSRLGLQQRPQFNPQFRPPSPQQQQRPQFPGPGQIRPGPPLQRPLAPNQPLPQRQPIPPRPQFIRPQQPRPPGPPPQQLLQQQQQQQQSPPPPPPPKSALKHPNLEQNEPPQIAPNKEQDGNVTVVRSMSQNSNPDAETRRVSISSVEETIPVPSRPESRASAQTPMRVIQESVSDDRTTKPKTLPLNHPNPGVVHEKPPKKPEMHDVKTPSRPKTPSKKEGDNDSGVDESTQGNDASTNGEHSPRKSARNNSRLTTPTKNRSFSRGSRSPNLKSPDSTPSTPGGGEKKKLPMNKIQVGSAPSPNLKVIKSKIGSLANANYKPGGGHVKIETKKIDVSSAHSKIGAKNETYTPSGGDKKIISQKLQWNAKSKIGSLENTTHKPKGGDKKIESVKLDFKEKAKPKVGSKDNMKYIPGGGDVKSARDEKPREVKEETIDIETKKLSIKSESKVGSLDNMKHKPGGGDKKIFDDKDYLRQKSGLSNENNSVSGSQVIITEEKELPRRPSSRLSRNNSLKRSTSTTPTTPRTPWKY